LTSWRSAVRVSYIPSFFLTILFRDFIHESFVSAHHSSHSTQALRHSCSKLLAYAVTTTTPGTFLVGEAHDDIFFSYDFVTKAPLTEELLPLFEEIMRSLIQEKHDITSCDMTPSNAAEYFSFNKQDIKCSQVKNTSYDIIPMTRINDFLDTAEGPYLPSTKDITAFRLCNITTYTQNLIWGPTTVTRVSGIAAHDKKSLPRLAKTARKANKRHHLTMGKKHQLLSSYDDTALVWQHQGAMLRHACEKMLISLCDDYKQVHTCDILPLSRFKGLHKHLHSSPYDHTHLSIGDTAYIAPSSHLLSHMLLFLNEDLSPSSPVRYHECGPLYTSPRLSFLAKKLPHPRQHSSTASIFCLKNQILTEVISSLNLIQKIATMGSIECKIYISGRSKHDETVFLEALEACGLQAQEISHERFSRIDVCWVDKLGREWEGPYIYLESSPSPLYKGLCRGMTGEGVSHAVVSSSFTGSLDGFCAMLIEDYKGLFPPWLSSYR
jgi:threonyl-tRNA synthetase